MRITLTQPDHQEILKRWILIRIETSCVCTQIWTSATLPPYKNLYVWLGQIRDGQLPSRMVIDEEGQGVKLVAERVNHERLCFYVEPWHCKNDDLTRLNVTLKSDELIGAFCKGILQFITNEYDPKAWNYIDNLSNLNWRLVLQPASIPAQKWQQRRSIYKGGQKKGLDTARECLGQSLTTEQQWLVVLYSDIDRMVLYARSGQIHASYAFVSLYQNLLADLILGEVDFDWYEKRRTEIEPELGNLRELSDRSDLKDVSLEVRTRLLTLRLGQLVDGRVSRIKPYGVFVDIAGCFALLSIFKISQAPITHPAQIFQTGDWVRAIIISLDIEKRTVLLSTRDLESESGDMLRSPLNVYESAEEIADRYRKTVLSRLTDT